MAPAVARSGSTLLDRNLVALRSTIKEIGYPLRGQGVSSEAERMINDATGTLVSDWKTTAQPTFIIGSVIGFRPLLTRAALPR